MERRKFRLIYLDFFSHRSIRRRRWLRKSSRETGFADVFRVEVRKTGPEEFSFAATISSPDTGWKKYANAFRVRTEKGKVFGTRILFHPHVEEQPFTRSLFRVKIPPEVREVIIDARDSVAGWGGRSVRVKLPR